MKDLLDYPLAAFRSAFRTILGWTAVMAVTTFGGFAVASAIQEGRLYYVWNIPEVVLEVTANAVCLNLPVMCGFFGTGLAWSLGLFFESSRYRIVLAVANAALWAAIATWAPFWLFWPPRG